MSIVLPKYLGEMLAVLPKPSNVWKYMLAITQIPRGSNMDNERFRHKKILSFLKNQAEQLHCETYVDKGENLIIKKPAFPGLEKAPTVCLQCHMDMVVQKNDDVDIDLDNDPLYLRATGTSLGADNGIGVATCFAILEDKDIKHGPLEVLVTRDEETGMFGADELESGILKAKYLINVDSEDENAICVGCSGGFTVDMTMKGSVEAFPALRKKIVLNDFCGGHSGSNIDCGRANPLHVLGRLLAACHTSYRLVGIDCGTADNAIPRKCVAEVAVAKEEEALFEKEMRDEFANFFREYRSIEKQASLTISTNAEVMKAMDRVATQRFVSFLEIYPFGVIRYSPSVKGDVETSTTCAIAKMLDDHTVVCTASIRSSSKSQMDMMYNKIKCICNLSGFAVSERKAEYPGWEPNMESTLTKDVAYAFSEAFGTPARVYSIHAGLECGLFVDKYPGIDCCSVGPSVEFPHSPEERLLIESVPRFYKALLIALDKISH